uniref:Uncharacterized protein n=1 Tax=Monodon monoceros TaxID=40151 RepID=A0A8C6BMQ1_MONMO
MLSLRIAAAMARALPRQAGMASKNAWDPPSLLQGISMPLNLVFGRTGTAEVSSVIIGDTSVDLEETVHNWGYCGCSSQQGTFGSCSRCPW